MQIGTPEEIYETPSSTFVASFLGQANFFRGSIEEKSGDIYTLKLSDNNTMKFRSHEDLKIGELRSLTIRPEKIEISSNEKELSIKGKVLFVTYVGDTSVYRIESMGQEVLVKRQNSGNDEKFNIGDTVYLSWKPENNLVLDWDGE